MNKFINFNHNNPENTELEYHGLDSELRFTRNKKKLGKEWIYYNKKIIYRCNEQGFRTDSFDSVNWKESVVVFGCSFIHGVGLAEEDTLVKQLEKKIERPVINLGVGGAGVDVACWNSLLLHENYQTPKAIIQNWSSLDRYTDYDTHRQEYVPHMPSRNDYYFQHNWELRSKKYILTDRALWRDKTVYLEGSFFSSDTLSSLNIKTHTHLDLARDLTHSGIETNRLAAEEFAKQLEKLI